MIKKIIAITTAAAFFAATAIQCNAAAIQYFYYWSDSQHGMTSWSGWLNQQHTSCMGTATYTDPNGIAKVLHVEAWRNKNTPQGEREIIADYYVTNTTATASIGPMDPQLYKYAIARVSVNGGAGGVIYADCTSN